MQEVFKLATRLQPQSKPSTDTRVRPLAVLIKIKQAQGKAPSPPKASERQGTSKLWGFFFC